jgi:hypothetical protein
MDNRRLSMLVISLVLLPTLVLAQQNADIHNAPAVPSTRPSRGSRSSFQQNQLDRIQEQLGATDEEWKVIEPRVQIVRELERSSVARRAGINGRARRGGAVADRVQASPSEATTSPVQQATRELEDSLGSKETKPEEIKSKLAALREARSKALADLSKARDNLREILTARQEAALVMLGILN